jgi:hypothetical protein
MSNDMLYKAQDLKTCTMYAVDGEIGTVENIYFDEITWEIRYLLSNPESRPDKVQRLVPSLAIDKIQHDSQSILVGLTRQQIENSPPLSSHQSVSRRYEAEYYSYYGWPPYWKQDHPSVTQHRGSHSMRRSKSDATVVMHPMYTHVYSADSLCGCAVNSHDGISGYVEDLVLDTKRWLITYLQINTQRGRPDQQRLISPGWIYQINMSQRAIHTDLASSLIRHAPGFDPAQAISPEYEARLVWHYGNPRLWRYHSDSGRQK